MANPNRTVARWRQSNTVAPDPREEAARHERRRAANPELYAIMDEVSAGTMTAEEAVQRLEALSSRKEVTP